MPRSRAGSFVSLISRWSRSRCSRLALIWLTTNGGRLANGQADAGGSGLALRRVGRLADGWMTHSVSPVGFRAGWATILCAEQDADRDPDRFNNVLCHHININEDADAALADAKRYLDLYYGAN